MGDTNGIDDASPSEAALEYFMYHEPQAAALCGVHALNSLLQGPYIDEFQCAEIAQQLDAEERALMAEAGMDTAEFLKFVAEDSANVDNSGMFSVQVLSKALEMWGLTLVPLSSPDAGNARAEPQGYTAFICNLQEHWFTIRKIHGEWWNLNSLFSTPEPLSPFYLAAFLGTLQEQGYTIFLVRGNLMEPDPDPDAAAAAAVAGGGAGGSGHNSGRWIAASKAREAVKEKQSMKQQGVLKVAASNFAAMASAVGQKMVLRPRGPGGAFGGGGGSGGSSGRGANQGVVSRAIPNLNDEDDDMFIGDDDDAELQRVLAASRQEMRGGSAGDGDGVFSGDDEEEDAELAAAIAASLADNEQQQKPSQQEKHEEDLITLDDQDDSVQVVNEKESIKPETASLPLPVLGEEPIAGAAGVLEIGLKLPTGERHSRRFLATDTVGHLAAFAAGCGVDLSRHQLATRFPRQVLENLDISLVEAKVSDKDMVFVEPIL